VTVDDVVGLIALAVAFLLGNSCGLWLAWSQEARIERWAGWAVRSVDRAQRVINDLRDEASA
jgi:hypothetical protein